MSDETVMQAGDRQGDRGLPEWRTDAFISARVLAREGEDSIAKHALTYALDVAEKACRERDAARAEVERLRGQVDDLRLGDNATIERLRAEMLHLESRAADVMGENVALAAEVERLRADALESIAREGVLRAEVERLRAELDERGRIEDEYLACSPMLLREHIGRLSVEVKRLRSWQNLARGRLRERDEVFRWLRQWRNDGWRPATPEHDRLVEWLESEGRE